VNAVLRFALVAVLILGSILPAAGRKRSSHSPPQSKTKSTVAPDVTGLGLASVEPVLIPYTVTDTDL
jgi:hypothetical protein